jgi:hypothetical protein
MIATLATKKHQEPSYGIPPHPPPIIPNNNFKTIFNLPMVGSSIKDLMLG